MKILIGLLLIGITVAIGMYTSRRKFNRRNEMGVEQFTSYRSMVKARTVEGALNLFAGFTGAIGIFVFMAGVIW